MVDEYILYNFLSRRDFEHFCNKHALLPNTRSVAYNTILCRVVNGMFMGYNTKSFYHSQFDNYKRIPYTVYKKIKQL